MNKPSRTRGAKAAIAPTSGATHRPPRILVIDDDKGICQLSAEVLVRHGYLVDAAEDNTAGLKTLQTHSYDLLITDLDMPELSGLRLVKKLRAARMALPVILASGTLTQLELSRNPWLRLSGVLLKPFSPDQLLEAVQSVLRVKNPGPNAGNANVASRE